MIAFGKARRGTLFITGVLALLLQWLVTGSDAQPKKIEVAYSAISATQAALWFTKEAGVFDKHGLTVNLNYVGSGTKVVQALIAGEFPIAFAGGATVFAVWRGETPSSSGGWSTSRPSIFS